MHLLLIHIFNKYQLKIIRILLNKWGQLRYLYK